MILENEIDISDTIAENPKLRKIVSTLQEHEYPLNAKKVASLGNLNYNTTRTYLNQLYRSGAIGKQARGFYYVNSMHGMGELAVPKVHNVGLRLVVSRRVEHRRFVEEFGGVRFWWSFGAKRSKVYCKIACDDGLDFNGFCLAVEHFRDFLLRELGIKPGDTDIDVCEVELNQDYVDWKMEGIDCLTVSTMKGTLERMYNKRGKLRSEVKVKPDSVYAIYALLKGGVSSYNILQGIFLQNERLADLTRVLKFQNRKILETVGFHNRVLQSLFRDAVLRKAKDELLGGYGSKEHKGGDRR